MTSQAKKIERMLLASVGKDVRKFQAVLFQVLTSATPVDTGFARASLTPSVGSPILDELKRPNDDESARNEAGSRLAENKSRSAAIATTYKLEQGRVFFTYRAGYVTYLNEGSSSQAPKKFIERAIAIAGRGF